MTAQKQLTSQQSALLVSVLKSRFQNNMARHPKLEWPTIEAKLQKNPGALWSLSEMENTGGQPDVVTQDNNKDSITFIDCSPESPAGRRSLCYDQQSLQSRKEHKPKNSAHGMAKTMGIQILTENQYRHLQTLGQFDTKTSSWLETPPNIRKLGGAIFADRRYNHVFVYHNGAESYYASRGFRGSITF